MADEQQIKAKKIYSTMVSALKKSDWHFAEDEDNLTIISSFSGEDIPIKYIIQVDAEREVVQFMSPMMFRMPEDKRVDGAIAVCVANYGMVNGSFDYNINDGEISFRLTTSYVGCEIGEEFFMHMMVVALSTTDRYNDKFLMLSKGVITVQQFVESDES